jgi:hypothetical protein
MVILLPIFLVIFMGLAVLSTQATSLISLQNLAILGLRLDKAAVPENLSPPGEGTMLPIGHPDQWAKETTSTREILPAISALFKIYPGKTHSFSIGGAAPFSSSRLSIILPEFSMDEITLGGSSSYIPIVSSAKPLEKAVEAAALPGLPGGFSRVLNDWGLRTVFLLKGKLPR